MRERQTFTFAKKGSKKQFFCQRGEFHYLVPMRWVVGYVNVSNNVKCVHKKQTPSILCPKQVKASSTIKKYRKHLRPGQ